ncbi:hypothetical protein KEM52_005790, partial [Ascosphaera acerosa]
MRPCSLRRAALAGLALLAARPDGTGIGVGFGSVLVSAAPLRSTGDDVQRRLSDEGAQRAEEVRDAFRFAWDGYYEFAFPHDE